MLPVGTVCYLRPSGIVTLSASKTQRAENKSDFRDSKKTNSPRIHNEGTQFVAEIANVLIECYIWKA